LRAFFDENGGDWPVIPEDTNRSALAFGVTGVPESYVVSPAGIVVAKFEGVTANGLDRVINGEAAP
jgi:cytochrome c biogenesis protein CcmG/thiol:disulfide interchange protein DsbE